MKKVDIYAFICAVLIVAGWYFYSASVKDNAPATDWFVVRNVSVPDFIAGSDPPVNYDRVIKKEFFGRWSVEVHGTTQSTNYAICTGSGQNHYEPTETLPDTGVSMSWFMGVDGDVRNSALSANSPRGNAFHPFSTSNQLLSRTEVN